MLGIFVMYGYLSLHLFKSFLSVRTSIKWFDEDFQVVLDGWNLRWVDKDKVDYTV